MNRPWMPLYIADYRADTAHLGAAEHGAYLLLIMHYWQTSGLPTDDVPLARIACMTPSEWRKARPVIAPFFSADWKHKRIEVELAKMVDVSNKRRASAEQRHSKRPANAPANAPQMDTHFTLTLEERKQDAAHAAAYAFENSIIRLTERDFNKWRESFSYLDLKAELIALTPWAEQQGNRWFHAVAAALAKRNREIKASADKAKTEPGFKWNGIEGVI